jgi:hypothetical protein
VVSCFSWSLRSSAKTSDFSLRLIPDIRATAEEHEDSTEGAEENRNEDNYRKLSLINSQRLSIFARKESRNVSRYKSGEFVAQRPTVG